MERGQGPQDRAEPDVLAIVVGALYVALGLLGLWWIMAPPETLYTTLVDTPIRIAQTARLFRSAAIRSGEHPNSWRVRDYPHVHHGVINAEPAMLGLDSPRAISLQLQRGREFRFIDHTASTELLVAADTTYVIDPAHRSPWQPPLLKIDSRQPAALTRELIEVLSTAGSHQRHLIVVTTATGALLASGPLREWLLGEGVDLAVLEGTSRPALMVISPESSAPRMPYVIASPRGFLFRF